MSKGNLSKIDNLGRVVIPKSIRKALNIEHNDEISMYCLLYTSPSPRDVEESRMPSSA